VLEAAEQLEADRALRDAYRRIPQDPALVSSARRLAARTAPEWQRAPTSSGRTLVPQPGAGQSAC
jgi:hypothetical protein